VVGRGKKGKRKKRRRLEEKEEEKEERACGENEKKSLMRFGFLRRNPLSLSLSLSVVVAPGRPEQGGELASKRKRV
jgi:hypothetical protein